MSVYSGSIAPAQPDMNLRSPRAVGGSVLGGGVLSGGSQSSSRASRKPSSVPRANRPRVAPSPAAPHGARSRHRGVGSPDLSRPCFGDRLTCDVMREARELAVQRRATADAWVAARLKEAAIFGSSEYAGTANRQSLDDGSSYCRSSRDGGTTGSLGTSCVSIDQSHVERSPGVGAFPW
jgi:hypothetical protein